MLNNLFTAFWFFLPAGIANMTPVFVSKIPILKKYNYPADLYLSYKGKRILGNHKTIRGFTTGIIAGITAIYIQRLIINDNVSIRNLLTIDYQQIDPVLLGFLLSFGALIGDSIKSFFKRQAGIKPGKKWFPFDQADFIIGGILFSLFYIRLELVLYLYVFAVYFLLHPLTTITGYLLKLKHEPI